MGAYHSFANWIIVIGAVLVMVRAQTVKGFRGAACEQCHMTDGHAVGCPGRRGY